jgi:NADPH:quinone reductase-like Zn-dependent oxidoreductase
MCAYNLLSQLTDRNIGSSRETSFEHLIMSETNGRGVDLVFNSLTEEMLLASVRCLAHRGRFLEIGTFNLQKNNTIGIVTILLISHGFIIAYAFVKYSKTIDNDLLFTVLEATDIKMLKIVVLYSLHSAVPFTHWCTLFGAVCTYCYLCFGDCSTS